MDVVSDTNVQLTGCSPMSTVEHDKLRTGYLSKLEAEKQLSNVHNLVVKVLIKISLHIHIYV